MSDKLRTAIRKALETASVTQTQLSEEAGYHFTSLSRIKTGQRGATPEAARGLAKALRRRSARLLQLANQLERAAEQQEGG